MRWRVSRWQAVKLREAVGENYWANCCKLDVGQNIRDGESTFEICNREEEGGGRNSRGREMVVRRVSRRWVFPLFPIRVESFGRTLSCACASPDRNMRSRAPRQSKSWTLNWTKPPSLLFLPPYLARASLSESFSQYAPKKKWIIFRETEYCRHGHYSSSERKKNSIFSFLIINISAPARNELIFITKNLPPFFSFFLPLSLSSFFLLAHELR